MRPFMVALAKKSEFQNNEFFYLVYVFMKYLFRCLYLDVFSLCFHDIFILYIFSFHKYVHMKANADKCHLLVTRDTYVTTKIGEFDVKNSRKEKLLGVKIDSKLSFENHISSLCEKASQKLHALARFVNCIDLAKRTSLMKAFIISQFNNCPLIWMFHSRQLNNRIQDNIEDTGKSFKASIQG